MPIGGKRVVGLRAFIGVLLAGLGREPEAREQTVAAGGVRREGAQGLRRLLVLAFLVEAQRVLVAHGGRLGAGALEVLPIAPAADRRDDQDREPDDQAVVALPDLRRCGRDDTPRRPRG